jgi:hypothetical protein
MNGLLRFTETLDIEKTSMHLAGSVYPPIAERK